MKPILIDINRKNLLPLTFNRPVMQLLLGIDTIFEKWKRHLDKTPGMLTAKYLHPVYQPEADGEVMLINGAAIPSPALIAAISGLSAGEVLTQKGQFLAAPAMASNFDQLALMLDNDQDIPNSFFGDSEIDFKDSLTIINSPADIFAFNDAILRSDFFEITQNTESVKPGAAVFSRGKDIFIHPEAKINHCVLNAETGPIYIGKGAEVMEGCLIRGPFALGENATLKMGAKIYGASSIGQHSKVGGEVNNCIINAYSNKGHDGFLGNSVIGSWCNLGADTNTSNLKNNYSEVSAWNYPARKMTKTGRIFQGLIMGDHSKAGINTMFNTGSVVGMCANIFDSGFPPKFVPSFSWGSARGGFEVFKMEKAIEVAKAMMERRSLKFGEAEGTIFQSVFERTAKFRNRD